MRSHRPRAEQTAERPRTRLLRRATGVAVLRPVRGDLTSARPVNGRHGCASGLDGAVVVTTPPWSTNGGPSDALSSTTSREQTAEASYAALATSYWSCGLASGQRRSNVSPACEWSARVCYRAGWCSSGDSTTVKHQRRSFRRALIDPDQSSRLTPRTRL